MSSHRVVPPTPATADRVLRGLLIREEDALHDASVPAPAQIDNGDETRYADKSGSYTKGIKQASVGIVDPGAYATFREALDSGSPADFNAIIVGGGPRKLNGPQGGLAFSLDCLENSQFSVPPAPALAGEQYAAELIELYWASLLRDVPFVDYSTNSIAEKAAAELTSLAGHYKGPKSGNAVTPDLLFRGRFKGETDGPYLSQFLLQDTALGAMPIIQKYSIAAPCLDYMKDALTFLDVQNGANPSPPPLQPPLYLFNGRGLTTYTHLDVLYQACFIAYLILNAFNKFNPGNPYNNNPTQNGFGTFGAPDAAAALAAVSALALKAVWYQKWFIHLRHRPESGGALVYLQNTPSHPQTKGKVSDTVLNSSAVAASLAANSSYFLSQAFPEGSPMHPAYPTGHGTVAGACITVLKFFYDGAYTLPKVLVPAHDGAAPADTYSRPPLTVNGELNKLASNISFGHGIHAGIHWRSDTETSIRLGEHVALSFLQDHARAYNEKFRIELERVDGSMATIAN
ncbi:MAG TPA: hypothetical protein VH351_09455 [Bryobacteraceae bacterium]|jgi:hypothetical protein|nr:hypothetical protein [Bryobacteraceae bacterium]